jgi:hypothetical protein
LNCHDGALHHAKKGLLYTFPTDIPRAFRATAADFSGDFINLVDVDNAGTKSCRANTST